MKRDCSPRAASAFTLVELLVVIAIIGILASLLVPALSGTKERMRRATCRNDMRQFILTAHLYAVEHLDKLPSGASETTFRAGDEHIPMISGTTRDQLIHYAGSKQILSCPNWREYFKKRLEWRFPIYGFVLGYNYLGGRYGTPWPIERKVKEPSWISPQSLSDSGALVLVTDPNNWSVGFARSFVPHTKRGFRYHGDPINDSEMDFTPGFVPTPKELGAQGGNVGRLDGSVEWKPIRQMQVYRGSGYWDDAGCWTTW